VGEREITIAGNYAICLPAYNLEYNTARIIIVGTEKVIMKK